MSGCEQLDPFVFTYLLRPPSSPGCMGRIILFVSLCQSNGVIEYRFEESASGLQVFHSSGDPCFPSPQEPERAYDLAVESYIIYESTARSSECNAPFQLVTVSSKQFRVMCQRLCTQEVVDFIDEQWVTTTQLTYEPCMEGSGCCTTTQTWCYNRGTDEYESSEAISTIVADCSGNPLESNCNILQSPTIGEQTQEDPCRARCNS